MTVRNSPPLIVAHLTPASPLSQKDKFRLELKRVCDAHEISPELILDGPRAAFIVKARRDLAFALRQKHGWSLTIIARLLHKRDHTTVRHLIVQHAIEHGLALPAGLFIGTRPRTIKRKRAPKRKRRTLAKTTRKAIRRFNRAVKRKATKLVK